MLIILFGVKEYFGDFKGLSKKLKRRADNIIREASMPHEWIQPAVQMNMGGFQQQYGQAPFPMPSYGPSMQASRMPQQGHIWLEIVLMWPGLPLGSILYIWSWCILWSDKQETFCSKQERKKRGRG